VEDMVVADMVCGRYGTDPLTSCMRISHCRPSLTYFIIYLEAEFRGPLTEMLAIATHSTSYFFGTKAIRSAAYIGFRIIIITVNVYSAFFCKRTPNALRVLAQQKEKRKAPRWRSKDERERPPSPRQAGSEFQLGPGVSSLIVEYARSVSTVVKLFRLVAFIVVGIGVEDDIDACDRNN